MARTIHEPIATKWNYREFATIPAVAWDLQYLLDSTRRELDVCTDPEDHSYYEGLADAYEYTLTMLRQGASR